MAQNSSAHRRALIVEDEPWFAMGLAADMQALGFDCDLVGNGQDAFLQAMEDAPDIVLMDVNLEGGREGIEAARWLREVCDIPVVFITAHTDLDTVERIHQQVPDAPAHDHPNYRRAALQRIPPVVDMPGFPGANEPCRKHAFAITSHPISLSLSELRLTLGYLTT